MTCPLRLVCGMTATGNTLKCADRSPLIGCIPRHHLGESCLDLIIYVFMETSRAIAPGAIAIRRRCRPQSTARLMASLDYSVPQLTATQVVQLASYIPNWCNIIASTVSCSSRTVLLLFFNLPFDAYMGVASAMTGVGE